MLSVIVERDTFCDVFVCDLQGLGIFGKLSAEAEQRRGRFMQELDFVLCNLLTAFLVDFALVYLPAPSISLTGACPFYFIPGRDLLVPLASP